MPPKKSMSGSKTEQKCIQLFKILLWNKKNTRFNGQKKSYLIGQKNPRFNYRVVLVYRVFRFWGKLFKFTNSGNFYFIVSRSKLDIGFPVFFWINKCQKCKGRWQTLAHTP